MYIWYKYYLNIYTTTQYMLLHYMHMYTYTYMICGKTKRHLPSADPNSKDYSWN